MIHFAYPWLLCLIPLAWLLLWGASRRGENIKPALGYSSIALFKGLPQRQASRSGILPLTLFFLAVALLTGALARPQKALGLHQENSEGLDIIICLDTSPSMSRSDVAPDRMEAAKKISQQFVEQRPGDRIGVVAFSGIALTQCPLTVDHEAVNAYLQSVEVGMTRTDNTAIGEGLMTSIARLRNVEAKSKIIILVTDGRNNAGETDPKMAAKVAKDCGVKIYAIGVGAPSGSSVDPDSHDEIDEGMLAEVAGMTGGESFRAVDTNSLAEIYARIDKLEKRTVSRETIEYGELYQAFVLWGLACLGLSLILDNTVLAEVP